MIAPGIACSLKSSRVQLNECAFSFIRIIGAILRSPRERDGPVEDSRAILQRVRCYRAAFGRPRDILIINSAMR
jgi:hypothetical protein